MHNYCACDDASGFWKPAQADTLQNRLSPPPFSATIFYVLPYFNENLLNMPTPLAKGIIIAVSVIAAAGVAAYESPQVQEWLRQSRQKIAMALHSLGDDINPRSRSPRRSDASMHEDASDEAEARRRRARAEILERGRLMQERKRQRGSADKQTQSGSFDTLVNQDGVLWKDGENAVAESSAIDTSENQTVVGRQNGITASALHESVDSPILLRHLEPRPEPPQRLQDPFESTYEHEMRNAWNMPLAPAQDVASSHASESLIDYTPTSEAVPDPDFSVPDSNHLTHPLNQSEYFSANASTTSHTLSREGHDFYYAHPENPFQPLPPQNTRPTQLELPSVSSAPSIAGSTDHIGASEFDESSDGVLSEFGDGIRTPASAWTEVDSVIGSDAGQ